MLNKHVKYAIDQQIKFDVALIMNLYKSIQEHKTVDCSPIAVKKIKELNTRILALKQFLKEEDN
ncbi:hypothetical protein LN736_06275 [Clostridium sp. WLY-B-L2]|uniref:Uncharacterized protein n=1 Tax=Clostridium aromativorans TaxID=2836848 RepID=A0ABS8N3T9_9CLOT|nr:hypothetical protein [Clostridium aromativorans]MCC9294463.1 hypothetical protein [Clostridium aromativorans]